MPFFRAAGTEWWYSGVTNTNAPRWERRPVAAPASGVRRLRHPEVGQLRLTYETLEVADSDRQRLVVHLAADAATAAALDRLLGRLPGHLRPVAG